MKNEKNIKKRFLDILSFLISGIFSPYLLSVLFLVFVSFVYADNLRNFIPSLLVALFFIIIVPLGYTLWLLETKKITDIHLSNHKQRKIPFTITAISSLVGAIVLYFFHVPDPILAVAFTYSANAIVICFITWQWKISIHSVFFIASVLILVLFWGTKFWPLIFLWIPLAWSRIYRKKHTWLQLIAGALVAIFITIFVFDFFGYKIGG